MIRKLAHGIGLAVALVSLSGTFTAVTAAPAPLFDPVLDEIRQNLPEGWQFRLPAILASDGELYPFISEATDTKLIISLGITPDCASKNCTIGMIGATEIDTDSENLNIEGRDITPVDLGQELQGYHFLRGEGDAANQLVMWQQDGLLYAIATMADAMTQEQLVAVARSMASESPMR